MEPKRMVILSTVDPKKDPEKVSMTFAIAVTSLASEVETEIFFTLDGVFTALKDYVKGIDAHYYPPLPELMQAFIENGGKMFICQPSMINRNISEKNLIEGIAVVSAPSFVNDAVNASVLNL
ncbi:MAG: DsrE family protein [bacterium]